MPEILGAHRTIAQNKKVTGLALTGAGRRELSLQSHYRFRTEYQRRGCLSGSTTHTIHFNPYSFHSSIYFIFLSTHFIHLHLFIIIYPFIHSSTHLLPFIYQPSIHSSTHPSNLFIFTPFTSFIHLHLHSLRILYRYFTECPGSGQR